MKWATTIAVMSSMFTASTAVVPDSVAEDTVLISQQETQNNDQNILDNEGWLSGQELVDYNKEVKAQAREEIRRLNAWAKQQIREQQLAENSARLESMMDAVDSHVGKTPYVFSGSTPSGWDCSGLTSWAYARLGIELPHSAAAQLYSGKIVSQPKRGDLVIFGSGYHVGLYAGKGVMLHSGGHPGDHTEYRDISYYWGSVRYVRLLDTK